MNRAEQLEHVRAGHAEELQAAQDTLDAKLVAEMDAFAALELAQPAGGAERDRLSLVASSARAQREDAAKVVADLLARGGAR